METVYILWHSHPLPQDEDRDILIGVYSSKEEASAAHARVSDKPGFVDHPEGFLIEEMKINQDHWKEGFVTYTYGDEEL
jgi:hypothetical protein